jgi:hypothetical protein
MALSRVLGSLSRSRMADASARSNMMMAGVCVRVELHLPTFHGAHANTSDSGTGRTRKSLNRTQPSGTGSERDAQRDSLLTYDTRCARASPRCT